MLQSSADIWLCLKVEWPAIPWFKTPFSYIFHYFPIFPEIAEHFQGYCGYCEILDIWLSTMVQRRRGDAGTDCCPAKS
jgi:hypothetical protein